jgi:hypothetical protein
MLIQATPITNETSTLRVLAGRMPALQYDK